MRILFVSHYALPHLGGIEVAIDALAAELAARGHEVRHVASSATRGAEGRPPPRALAAATRGAEGRPPPRALAAATRGAEGRPPQRAVPGHAAPRGSALGPEPRGYAVVRVPAFNAQEARLGVPYPLFSPRLAAVMRREVAAADVVHAHGVLYESSALALWLARRAAARSVRAATEHVGHVGYASRLLDGAQRAAFATAGRATARAAEALVVLNYAVEAEMRALAPGREIVQIHNGVDHRRYRPAVGDERRRLRAQLDWDDRPRVLFVGRLVAKKGLDLALGAAAVAAGAWELCVVGPGEPPASLPSGVRVLGSLAPERVAPLYRAADAFLLPSRGEGFPITAQEAMASGLPVVLADDPGYAPYLEGAGPGVRLAAADPAALAAAVRAAIADREAGPRAAAHARAAFSWARTADAHEALWARIRARRDAATPR